jgi:thiol-disulfide isomerase/thioredoxin
MVTVRRFCMLGGLLGIGLALLSCARTKSVPIEDVHVTPVTGADIQRAVQDSGGKAVLINIWATWCGPCREEFPGLVRVAHRYQGQGLKVMLVSADDDADMGAIKKFLSEQGVDFPSYIKAEKDQEFIDSLDKRWSGALPATFIYDGSGILRDFWEGKASFNEFEQKVTKVLDGNKPKSTGGSS